MNAEIAVIVGLAFAATACQRSDVPPGPEPKSVPQPAVQQDPAPGAVAEDVAATWAQKFAADAELPANEKAPAEKPVAVAFSAGVSAVAGATLTEGIVCRQTLCRAVVSCPDARAERALLERVFGFNDPPRINVAFTIPERKLAPDGRITAVIYLQRGGDESHDGGAIESP